MTGEMGKIDSKGYDSNGESWPMHAYVARALRAPLRPWDVYLGPYIKRPEGRLWIGSDNGFEAYVCLWPGGVAPAFRDPIVSETFWHDDNEAAVDAARQVLRRAREMVKARTAKGDL